MIEIEFISKHGDYDEGDTLRVDRVSAQVLVDRQVAKVVEEVAAPEVESGGERARELNAAAAAVGEATTDTAPAAAADATDQEPTGDTTPPAVVDTDKAAPAPKGGRK